MPEPIRLHLDADTSRKALWRALVARGHDVTRTPNEWMPFDADDWTQLSLSSRRGRVLFTFNIRDFVSLHEQNTNHCGILLAAQQSWTLSDLIDTLDRFMKEADAAAMVGRVAWLNQWRP